jgi:hypothetical protein
MGSHSGSLKVLPNHIQRLVTPKTQAKLQIIRPPNSTLRKLLGSLHSPRQQQNPNLKPIPTLQLTQPTRQISSNIPATFQTRQTNSKEASIPTLAASPHSNQFPFAARNP